LAATHFHFITAVWGQVYTDLFLQIVLPNQLSLGNLPFFRDKPGSATYKIYTTQGDADRIRQSPIYARVTEAVAVEIERLDDIDLGRKYSAMSECHRRAIRAADEAGAALVFLSPDLIWSDGTFKRLWEHAQGGTRVVMIGSIRVTKETFVPEFMDRHFSRSDATASVTARDLVRLALKHLHPVTKALFVDSDHFDPGTAHLYWRVTPDGILARCFHLHPLMVNPVVRGLLPLSTIDADYTPLACPDPKVLYVVEDSDEIAGFEVSAREQFGTFKRRKFRAVDAAFYARYWTQRHHREFVDHPIRIHACDLTPQWQSVESASNEVVQTIQRYLRYPAIYLPGKILARAARKSLRYLLLPFLGESGVERLKRRLMG
jgi:hypothetical protein